MTSRIPNCDALRRILPFEASPEHSNWRDADANWSGSSRSFRNELLGFIAVPAARFSVHRTRSREPFFPRFHRENQEFFRLCESLKRKFNPCADGVIGLWITKRYPTQIRRRGHKEGQESVSLASLPTVVRAADLIHGASLSARRRRTSIGSRSRLVSSFQLINQGFG